MNGHNKIDLLFSIIGTELKVDHGFALFGAVSRLLPIFHDTDDVALALIRGRYRGNGLLELSARFSRLVFRLPVDQIANYINLAGKELDVGGYRIRIGVPNTRALVPATALYAHIVTTKNGNDEERFSAEVSRQLESMGCKGMLTIGKRRTFQIHGKQLVGYSMLVSQLTAEESIMLQERGLGGRRKMGCGFFEPWRGR